MTTATIVSSPTAREWRGRLRTYRRRHHGGTWGEVLTQLYTLLWIVAIYGGALVFELRRMASISHGPATAERQWIAAAILLACAGAAWKALGAFGPVMASQAEQSWILSSPVDRSALLLRRCVLLVLATALAGAAATSALMFVLAGGGFLVTAAAGTAGGAAIAGASVLAQRPDAGDRWPPATMGALFGAGAAVAALVVAANYGGLSLPSPTALAPGSMTPGILTLAVLLAVAATMLALRTLATLDRAALGAGAELAGTVVTATVWMDLSLLRGTLETRYWRRRGRLASGRLFAAPAVVPARIWALLQTEARRAMRRPGALAVWAGLALAQFALEILAPSLAGVGRVIGAYLAGGQFASGLRTISRSGGLRRTLGGSDLMLRLVHLVIPAFAASLWWFVTLPAGGTEAGLFGVVLLAGAVGAVYRAATRPPMQYDGLVTETPFGLLPIGLVLQLARGPDLLGAVVVLQLLF